jgi:hypothetical protein
MILPCHFFAPVLSQDLGFHQLYFTIINTYTDGGLGFTFLVTFSLTSSSSIAAIFCVLVLNIAEILLAGR